MDRANRTNPNESTPPRQAADSDRDRELERQRQDDIERQKADERDSGSPNPPRTTTGRMTAPKFGSATSGGGELEPGPERD